jgi:hypothetical protein
MAGWVRPSTSPSSATWPASRKRRERRTSAGSARSGSARPRFVPGAGEYDSVTKFGGGVGLGVKTFFAKNVGLRLEGRAFYTLVKGEGGAFCVNGSCLFAFSGSGLWQGDVSAGLILAF